MLNVELLTDEASLLALAPEWSRLDESLSPRTPFTSPGWSITWWRHYSRNGLLARDEMQVFVLRDEAGALVAIAPMMLTHRPAFGPLRTRELQFFGADTYVTEVRGPICRPEHVQDVACALEHRFNQETSRWDWIQWRGLRKTEENALWLKQELLPSQYSEVANHYLELPATWEEFRSSLSRNIKESLRKCYNSLARDGHEFTLEVVSAPHEVAPALDLFFELHRRRAGQEGTIDHLDVFSTPVSRLFLRDYMADVAEHDHVRIFQLKIGSKVIATRIGLVLGTELYLYYSGYEVDWGKYSVMTTTVAEAIKWAIANGFSIVNLSTGTDVSKTRWRPAQVLYALGFELAPTIRARVAYFMIDRLRRLRNP